MLRYFIFGSDRDDRCRQVSAPATLPQPAWHTQVRLPRVPRPRGDAAASARGVRGALDAWLTRAGGGCAAGAWWQEQVRVAEVRSGHILRGRYAGHRHAWLPMLVAKFEGQLLHVSLLVDASAHAFDESTGKY
jgi:hypothetical protein